MIYRAVFGKLTNPRCQVARELINIKNFNVTFDVPFYGEAALSVRDLVTTSVWRKFFNRSEREKLHLLQDINLVVNEGERLGILGVNGTGKTTLCRHIAGLEGENSLCSGKVVGIFNTVIGVMPELTGRENAEILTELLYGDLSAEEKREIVRSSISFSELGRMADTPFKVYSKGMMARLFLSVVSSRPAEVLILDEVFDGADIFFNKKITERIMGMIKKSGCVLFVSHDLVKLEEVCNRGIVINKGKLQFDGDIKSAIRWYEENCNPLKENGDGVI